MKHPRFKCRAKVCPAPCRKSKKKKTVHGPLAVDGFRFGCEIARDRPSRYVFRSGTVFGSVARSRGTGPRATGRGCIERTRGTGPRATFFAAGRFSVRLRDREGQALALRAAGALNTREGQALALRTLAAGSLKPAGYKPSARHRLCGVHRG